jgi:hypothetical protein
MGRSLCETYLVLCEGCKPLDIVVLQKGAIQAEVPSSTPQRVKAGNKFANTAAVRLERSKYPVVAFPESQTVGLDMGGIGGSEGG